MSLAIPNDRVRQARFPRVSGDEPGIAWPDMISGEFSPREWG